MVIKEKQPISTISWLTSLKGTGCAKLFYEPESIDELVELCKGFYTDNLDFDLIGHTSNTLYTPDYCCERMVSTRKLNNFVFEDNYIECDCGTSVRKLALKAVEKGVKGFEGLIDLPGTVASAIYGHATCYGCDLSSMLIEATILTDDGKTIIVNPDWFEFTFRNSVLKKGLKKAVILSLKFQRNNDDATELKRIADKNHEKRRSSQPEARNSLGSIFAHQGRRTFLNYSLAVITRLYGIILFLSGKDAKEIDAKRRHLTFAMLFATDVEPYIQTWNWYQWKDEKSHSLFWKYVKIHKLMFTKSVFEIIIKKPNEK